MLLLYAENPLAHFNPEDFLYFLRSCLHFEPLYLAIKRESYLSGGKFILTSFLVENSSEEIFF